MIEKEWTPGPWENQGEDAFADMPFIRIGVGDRTICEALPPVDAEEIDDETRANANLMAAAPDMYEATDWVDKLVEAFGECSGSEYSMTLPGKKIRALIDARRKARGE